MERTSIRDCTLSNLIDNFAAGIIPREDFWRAMLARHVGLREYHPLLKIGVIKSIEIDGEARVACHQETRAHMRREAVELRDVPICVGQGARFWRQQRGDLFGEQQARMRHGDQQRRAALNELVGMLDPHSAAC